MNEFKNKKILIIGTGYGQLPIITKCKELGIYSIGVDVNPKSVGANFVDIFENIDVTNLKKCLQIAEKYKIDGVATMQSDFGVPTVGYINSKINLNGINFDTAKICTDKELLREKLKNSIIKQPNFEIVDDLNQVISAVEEIGCPCIVKPVDSSGSKGVKRVDNLENAKDAFLEAKRYSQLGKVIIEKFIVGEEFGAQTFSLKNNSPLIFFHNDKMSTNGFFVPIGHSYPLKNKIELKKYYSQIKNVLENIGILDGPANIDLIIDEKGDMYIIEIGARVGATCLLELTSRHTGLDWTNLIIKSCLGKLNHLLVAERNPCAAQILQSPKDGKLVDINFNLDLKKFSNFDPDVEITAKIGQNVSLLRKGTDRIGKVVVSADSLNNAESICNEIISKIEFKVE